MSTVPDTATLSDRGQKLSQFAILERASLPNWSKDYFLERFTEISSFEEDGRSRGRQIGIFEFDYYEEKRVLVVWTTGDTGLPHHKGEAFMQAFIIAHRLALRENLLPRCAGFIGNASSDVSEFGYIFEMPEHSNDKTPLEATLPEDFFDTSQIMSPLANTTTSIDWEAEVLQHLSLPNFSLDHFRKRFTETLSFGEDKGWLRHQAGIFELDNTTKRRVFVEWRATGTGPLSHKGDAFLQAFILAHRLALRGPSRSLSPICIGFVGDACEGESRHGYIFEMPEGSKEKTLLRTLKSILGDSDYEPTFLQQVSLASKVAKAVLRLHESDWLHRGIHSGNILFCFDQGKFDIGKPILSGFDYPRPETDTVKPDGLDTRWDIYRWPNLQSELPRAGAWQILHDVYSMGTLILEIAHWKPLYDLLCLKRWPAPSQQALRIRSWLIEEEIDPPFEKNPLLIMRGVLPNAKTKVFLSTASRCIHAFGREGLLVARGCDQSRESHKAHICKMFSEFVIEKLDALLVETADEDGG